MTELIDMTGMRRGALIVLRRVVSSKQSRTWACRCDCGVVRLYRTSHLHRVRSCGCLALEGRKRSAAHKASVRKRVQAEYRKRNAKACRDRTNAHHAKERQSLADRYVLQCLTQACKPIAMAMMPKSLIEVKRLHLIVSRMLRELRT